MGDRTCQNEIEQDNMSILVIWEAVNTRGRYHPEVQVVGNEVEEFVWDKIMKWGSMTTKNLKYGKSKNNFKASFST